MSAVLLCLSTLCAAQHDFALAPGESRQWTVELSPPDAMQVRIERFSGDLRLTIKTSGNASREINASRFSVAPIEVIFIGEAAAHAEIVAANSAPAGGPPCTGRIVLSDPYPATVRDREGWGTFQKMAAAQALERQSKDETAVRNAWQAVFAELAELGDRYNLASAHRSLAGWLAGQQDFQAARAEYLLALEILAGSEWRFEEAVVRQNVANIYSQTGDYRLAIEQQKIALKIRNELNDQTGKGIALYGLGIIAWRMGAYQQALDYYRQSLAVWRSLGERGWQAQVLNATGLLDVSLGRPRAAEMHYREANSIWRELHDDRSRAMAVSNEGLLEATQGDTAKAEELFREALAIYERIEDRIGIAYVTQNLGDVAANAGNHAKAIELYTQSLRLKDQLGDAKGAASSHIRLSLSYLALQQTAEAKKEIETSLQIARRISAREEEAQALGAWAKLHLQASAYSDAGRNIAEAIEIIENTRLELRTRDTRAGYFSTVRDYYDLAMDVAAAQEGVGLERAWTWSERARSRTLLDTLGRAGVNVTSSPGTIASFAQLRKELLDRETLLVQYSVSPERTLAWVVGATTTRLVRLPGSDALKQALKEAEEGKLQRISDLIWKPLCVTGHFRTIVVAPEGGLEQIPFAALPVGSNRTLVDQSEVVNIPSVSLLVARRRERKAARGAPAIFADAVFSSADIRVKAGASETAQPDALPRLRFTREEAIALSKLLGPGTQVATDFDASLERLLSAASSPGPLLHIASHAVIEEDDPSQSRIILSRVTPSGARIQGDLTLDEIFSLKVRKDLVVLSACSTAKGAELRGEGLMSFARAFLYAGAKGLIGTLYPVDDRASSEFVKRFYAAMFTRGESLSSALRQAQLEMKADPRWRSPRIWAAFVLFGDWSLRLAR